MSKYLFYISIIYICLVLVNACDFENSKARVISIADSTKIEKKVLDKIYLSHHDFYKKLKEANYKYERNLLNSTINIRRYITDTTTYKAKLASNLGVYLSDFTYTTLNNAGEDALSFLKGIERLNRAIQTQESLDSQFVTRVEINLDKKDSLFNISGQVFREIDENLRRTELNDLAIVMLAGSWVENMYHKLQIIERNQADSIPTLTRKNKQLLQEVFTQAKSAKNLYELFQVISKRQELGSLLYGINILRKAFEDNNLQSIETKEKNAVEVLVIDKSGELVLKNMKTQSFSESSIKDLREKITAIRFEIVK